MKFISVLKVKPRGLFVVAGREIAALVETTKWSEFIAQLKLPKTPFDIPFHRFTAHFQRSTNVVT